MTGHKVAVRLAYGEEGLPVELPEATTVIEPVYRPGLADPAAALTHALRDPVGCPPLRELARSGARVAISVCDGTRAQPRRSMVPAVLAELGDAVRPDDVTILVATGTHRANTHEELGSMLGEEVVGRCRVVNHDARDAGRLVEVGAEVEGVQAILSKDWVDADLRITTGFVEPHFFAGFSGGPKMVAPGLAGIDTILALHDARRIGHPKATWGVIEGNPVQEGLRAVTRLAPPHISLDVVLNRDREITEVFAGEVFAMHALACESVRRTAMRAVPRPFDVVVTTNSGYPLDQNLYQTVKGMAAAARVVKEGGLILCASECRDGLPDHGSFAELLKSADSPEALLQAIEGGTLHSGGPGPSVVADQWQAQIQARIQRHARVAVHAGGLTSRQLAEAHLDEVADIGTAVDAELARLGPGATVCALPEGPQTIPYLG